MSAAPDRDATPTADEGPPAWGSGRLLLALPGGLTSADFLTFMLRLPAENGRVVDRHEVGRVPEQLGLDARIALRRVTHERLPAWDTTVVGGVPDRRATVDELEERVHASGLPAAVVARSIAVLRAQHAAVAADAGTGVAGLVVTNDVDARLVEVVAGVLAWWRLGTPAVRVWGPLMTGRGAGPGATALVARLASRPGPHERELLTPAGAALLASVAESTTMQPPRAWTVRVADEATRREGRQPLLGVRLS